jgi:hypothetical protein
LRPRPSLLDDETAPRRRPLLAALLLANDLLVTALNALFCGAVLYLTFDRFWTGAAIGTAVFVGIILFERTKSGRWWWNVGAH